MLFKCPRDEWCVLRVYFDCLDRVTWTTLAAIRLLKHLQERKS